MRRHVLSGSAWVLADDQWVVPKRGRTKEVCRTGPGLDPWRAVAKHGARRSGWNRAAAFSARAGRRVWVHAFSCELIDMLSCAAFSALEKHSSTRLKIFPSIPESFFRLATAPGAAR